MNVDAVSGNMTEVKHMPDEMKGSLLEDVSNAMVGMPIARIVEAPEHLRSC